MSEPFDGNDYRKRVLAAVHRRGGPDASDPFELYDLEPVDDLDDAAVAVQLDAVWAFWQRQRDHPKYRVLVAELVSTHPARSAELRDPGRRRIAAARVRAQREQRAGQRYALLDAAISRLVDRHGAVPRDKIDGLHEVGALAGLSRDEVTTRLRRHRVAAPPPVGAGIGAERRRQLRALLAEFGRLAEVPAPPTLLALLEVPATASDQQIAARAGAWRSRARELRPGRLRAVVDELLVHVAELLEPGRAAVAAYLEAVAADVTEHLRPRVRAAVLVEDRLVAADHAHLLDEAMELGLDRVRAVRVLAAVAAELGAAVEPTGPAEPPRPADPAPVAPQPPRTSDREWEQRLRDARAALRAGRPEQARRLVAEAESLAGPDGRTPIRALSDEVRGVLADAERQWRAASADCAARRYAAALPPLEHLQRTASDLPGAAAELGELLARVRSAVQQADEAVAHALAGPESERAGLLLAVLAGCPGHSGALAELARIPVPAPSRVRAVRAAGGEVVVSWVAAAGADVTYKVSRRRPDGSWQVVGRVTATSIEDGGAPAGVEVPVYAVLAVQQGRMSPECRSDADAQPGSPDGPPTGSPAGPRTEPPDEPAAEPVAGPRPPAAVSATRSAAGSVTVHWSGPSDVEYRVRCRGADGRWRVVGRTTAHELEDGGAPAGPLPLYAVSAAADGARSAEALSDHCG
ncbi:MAG TPA: hypothetical protein VNO83_09770 [Pseudonocardia sp.]|nr:hypothetical protein [Pseudonocardia sp.]